MAVRSALRFGRPLPPGGFLVLISVRGWLDARTIGPLEGFGQLKNPTTSSRIEPATFRLVVQFLNQLRYRVPPKLQFAACILIFTFYITGGKIKRVWQRIFPRFTLLLIFRECNFYLSLSFRTLLCAPITTGVISYLYMMTFTCILVTRYEYEIVWNNRTYAILRVIWCS
jgi:hypothetical protein